MLAAHRSKIIKLAKPPPALALFLLAPAVGELLSGSAPPAEFFTPFGLAILVSLYGSGAVIVRELSTRWKKGIGSMLLLGAAYGILEEGLMVCSFFNPGWLDLGRLAVYGRWLDVNWVWAEMLIIYHAVYSITIPIVLVELAYPERHHEAWVDRRMLTAVFGLLFGVVVFGFLLFASFLKYWPPMPQYLLTIAVMVLFCYAAYWLPSDWGGHGRRPLPRLPLMWTMGAVGTFIFFIGFWTLPTLTPFWSLAMLSGVVLVLLYVWLLEGYEWKAPSDRHRFVLASGALTFFIVFAPLQELDPTRADNPVGMGLVGLAFLVGLVLLGRHVWARERASKG
ncbi:MAG: hypothetical protein WCC63_03715 [Candidatus Bathyarchaeia archaeon]